MIFVLDTTNLNNYLGRSTLAITRTMIHEAIHAELFRQVIELKKNPALQPVCPEGLEFEHLWCYYVYYKANGGSWQHEYMADFYIDVMSKELEKLHSTLSTQKWIDYVQEKEGWSWNVFFTYMSWEGLDKTDAFREAIGRNAEIKAAYDKYRSEASTDTKCY